MAADVFSAGPVSGGEKPVHGGQPGRRGCGGCTDCCHFPELSVTDGEATRLLELQRTLQGIDVLRLRADPANPGWQLMTGPCPFRRLHQPLQSGGCRIYDDRPAVCAVFTCSLLLDLRRSRQMEP